MLNLGYIGLSVLMVIIITFIGYKANDKTYKDKSKVKRKTLMLIGGLVLWSIYIFILGKSGILENLDFPPRFPVLLILPAFTFTGIFIYKNRNNDWIMNIPISWLVFYQSFRILIESLFVMSVAAGLLHYHVTVKGYNYDMFYGYSAWLIGLLYVKNVIGEKFLLFWNYFGLFVIAVIIFLFITTTFFPAFWAPEIINIAKEMFGFPYALVPGFLMPSAVFMHVLSIVRLNRNKSL